MNALKNGPDLIENINIIRDIIMNRIAREPMGNGQNFIIILKKRLVIEMNKLVKMLTEKISQNTYGEGRYSK